MAYCGAWNYGYAAGQAIFNYAPNRFRAPFYPSSRHPGGLKCAMADGSVRFVKDSIDSLPEANDYFGAGPMIYVEATNSFKLAPGYRMPVW